MTLTKPHPIALKRLTDMAHCSTDGVLVSISARNKEPYANGNGKVFLPCWMFERQYSECLQRSWRHELQHARDGLDGKLYSMTSEEAEKRACTAERILLIKE